MEAIFGVSAFVLLVFDLFILFPQDQMAEIDSLINMSLLVQVKDWHWTCHKPLPEPILPRFTDPYMYH